MKRNLLIELQEWFAKRSSKPWGCFETSGPDENGRIEFRISYNKAFVQSLHKQGFQGMTDEETTQMFFLSARILPEDSLDDESINPEATPNLTSEANTLRR
jgi:hypothetical protein